MRMLKDHNPLPKPRAVTLPKDKGQVYCDCLERLLRLFGETARCPSV